MWSSSVADLGALRVVLGERQVRGSHDALQICDLDGGARDLGGVEPAEQREPPSSDDGERRVLDRRRQLVLGPVHERRRTRGRGGRGGGPGRVGMPGRRSVRGARRRGAAPARGRGQRSEEHGQE
jgi:hypothetical protein